MLPRRRDYYRLYVETRTLSLAYPSRIQKLRLQCYRLYRASRLFGPARIYPVYILLSCE